ncbi:DUF3857 domain-containing protein, partial [bacterium]|nr:DUF3857 domain-containing protein [bacterium]
YGDIRLYIPGGYKLKMLKARTITPDGKKSKVKSKEIHNEIVYSGRTNNRRHRVYSFAFPEVTPGAILEYEYMYYDDGIILSPPFYFDVFNLPSRESTVKLLIPLTLQYTTGLANVYGLDYEESAERMNTATGKMLQYVATVRKLPAPPDEKYAPDPAFSRPYLMFALQRYASARSRQEYLDSWERGVERIEGYYSQYCNWNDSIDAFLKNQVTLPLDETEINTLFHFVADSIELVTTKDPYEVFPSVAESFEERRGTGMAKILLFREMLNKAGVQNNLLLGVPPRDGGTITELVLINQFTSALVQVHLDGQTLYYDPVVDGRAANYIPWYLAGAKMLILDRKNPAFLRLPGEIQPEIAQIQVDGAFAEDGSLDAAITITLSDPNKEVVYNYLADLEEDRLRKEITDRWLLDVDEDHIQDIALAIDGDAEPCFTMNVNIPDAAVAVEHSWLIKPNVFSIVPKDLLPVTEKRETHIHFGRPYKWQLNASLKLPEGCIYAGESIRELSDIGTLGYLISVEPGYEQGTMRYARIVERKHWSFPKTHYDELRDHFNKLAKADHIEVLVEPPVQKETQVETSSEVIGE